MSLNIGNTIVRAGLINRLGWKMDLKELAVEYNKMFGFTIIPQRHKTALTKWEQFKSGQRLEELQALNFNTSCNGLAVLLNDNLRCIDVDGCSDLKFMNGL
jgi:hypothetical protein